MTDRKPPRILKRQMRLELLPAAQRDDGTADDRIPIALSSEAPVERMDWYSGKRYLEVLDHGPGSVDLSDVADGMPFCLDHDQRAQIGLIEDLRLHADRKLRGMVRMGNHPDAAWVEADIRAGIRTKISVGYDPGEQYDERKDDEDGIPTRTYRGWKPMEGSSVAVPADMSVGVGRSAEPAAPLPIDPAAPGPKAEERGNMSDNGQPTPAPAGPSAAEQRDKDLKVLGDLAASYPEARDLLPSWLSRGVGVNQALKEVQDKQIEAIRSKATATPSGAVDMTPKERESFSIVRAIDASIRAMTGASDPWKDAGFEREVSNTLAKQMGRTPAGFLVPNNAPVDTGAAARVATRASVTGNIAATSSLGGAGVQTTIIGFIDLLRNKTQVAAAGATFLPGLTDTVQFTRQLTANTLAWTGENPSTANTLTASTLETITLSPKVAMSSTAFSRRLLAQFSFDVNAYVMNDLARVNAIGVDLAALFGTGSSNQPTGIRSQTGVTLQTIAANGAAVAWADIVTAEKNVENANADIGPMAWMVSPAVKAKWKSTLKSTTAGSAYLFADDGTVAGYPAFVTKQIPDNTTQGTSTTICSTPIFGVWDQLLIGQWGATDIVVDPYTYAQQNMIQVVTSLMVDINVRQPTAFNVQLGVLTT
jgi:HK97 family phage major capsid protein